VDIQKENDQLKRQIEVAREQLIKLESANGKVQVPLPSGGSVAAPTPAAEKPTPGDKPAPAEKQQQPKKEKPKKEKAPAADKPAAAPAVEIIDVGRLDLRVGKIVECSKHPDADALYLEKIDCGEAAPRTVVSGLVRFVPIEEMQNRMVVVLCNLKPAKMRGVTSEAMVMCASSPEKVEIMAPPAGAVPGDFVSCEGFTRNPDQPFMNPKKKIFETVAPDLMVNAENVGTFKGVALVVEGKGPIKSQTLCNVNIK
jgi:aminoacyl tRNA synthase complex-interacting multifunctional protein 1